MISEFMHQTPRALKRWIPQSLKDRFKKSSLYLEDRTEVDNVYHCCTHKSASQWMKALLNDPITFRHSGLDVFTYQSEWRDGYDPRPYYERHFSRPFPDQTFASPLYLHYSCFRQIPKPENHRAFFILRDPRDVVVSWYFSMKLSHPLVGNVSNIRQELKDRKKPDGLRYCIKYLSEHGLFDAQRSWVRADDPNTQVFRYEDLTGDDQLQAMRSLLVEHCAIPIPDSELRRLLKGHAFSKKADGRERGEEHERSHQRKGVSGDWRNHFDADTRSTFKSVTDDVAVNLGYEV
jgi:hypothetical protein